MTPAYILSTVVASNLVGVLCARSLHYQFYSWFYWSIPYAAYIFSRSYGTPAAIAIWAAQEWAWLQYPSTNLSSVVVVLSLVAWVWGLWRDGYTKYTIVRDEVEGKATALSVKKNI